MKIAVCIKQVPVSDQVEIDPITHQMIRSNADMTINPADMNALTEAITLKKEFGGTVDVYTMGSDLARSALVTAIAMGADEGYLVSDRVFAGGDSLGTAKVLAKAIEKQGEYDLILCGSLSSDGATGQTGPMMAELLNLPSITEVKEILRLESSHMEVYKSWKGQYLHMRVGLPAVITISLGSNAPILPTLRNQMKAKKKELFVITNEELKLTEEEIGLKGAKSIVTDTLYAKDCGKKSIFLSGTVEEQADQIIDLFKKAGE
ncbi:MAG: electron transfer flavoprotein subunit beta/FixA family protein [Eubacteriales bacterium]|nr:electron transfer flavoprotein subunit beta/FixA family protein [Eubacteriales bacterium]